jgi:hypothetical protein
MDWIVLAQDRDQWRHLVNVVMNLRISYNAGILLSGFTTGELSSSAQLHRDLRNLKRLFYPFRELIK